MMVGATSQAVMASLSHALSAAMALAFSGQLRDSRYDDPSRFLAGETQGRRWLGVSGWTIGASLAVLLLLSVLLTFYAPPLRDLPPEQLRRLMPYRIPAIGLLAAAGLALAAAVVARDRRRLRVEKLLRESEERMALAVEASGTGLWRWDAQSDDFWATSRCRDIFGLAPAPSYADMTAAIHPDDAQSVRNAIGQAMISHSSYEIQHRVIAGGQVRWVRSRGRPICGVKGQMIHIAGSVMDITERMTMQAEIERQRQSLVHLSRVGTIGELSGALAHELNQPLTAILSNAQAIQRILKQDPINIEMLRSAVADIIDDDARAGDVIRHLRALLKKDESRHAAVDMERVLHQVLNLARNELAVRRVFPVVRLSEMEPVQGDAVQLQQLVLNLVLNAAEAISSAGEENGIVIITSAVPGDGMLHLNFADTGPGLKPEILDRVFEPFFSTKKQGLGLGLSICHAIVESHGGRIEAANNSWDGATFRFTLPLAHTQ